MLREDPVQAEALAVRARIDTLSVTWLDIRAHVESRIREIRNKLETNLCFEETQQLRAQLRELKGVLDLAEVPEAPLVETYFDIPG